MGIGAVVHHRLVRRVGSGVLLFTVLGAAGAAGVYAWWHGRTPTTHRVTARVAGAAGMRVSAEFEIDGVAQDVADVADAPAEFNRVGRGLTVTVRRVAGPDLPVSLAIDVDGTPGGTGTALGGVRAYLNETGKASFRPVELEPEWKETDESEPPPTLIGTRAAEWKLVEWINSPPLRLADLRGRVVLARWFTLPLCDDCSATAPALREFDKRYQDLGLSVIGMYFHNEETVEEVQEVVRGYGYRFPVAIDRAARTKRLWCQGRYDHGYTSATFLLDRQGIIRYIHPGGRYVKGDFEYSAIESMIEQLLSEAPDDS